MRNVKQKKERELEEPAANTTANITTSGHCQLFTADPRLLACSLCSLLSAPGSLRPSSHVVVYRTT